MASSTGPQDREIDVRGEASALPAGVVLDAVELQRVGAQRRADLFGGTGVRCDDLVQWNAVTSAARVLRGVHVHHRHHDRLCVLRGHATVGLADLRTDAATAGLRASVELDGDAPRVITIPTGVAHGFYFHVPSLHVYAVSHYWDVGDELGCRWDDPDLALPWPSIDPVLSPRDAGLPTLAELRGQLASDAG